MTRDEAQRRYCAFYEAINDLKQIKVIHLNAYRKGGYNKVVAVSFPLVLSMGSTTVMEFTDRIFLGNYSIDALAAAMPAGITSFLFTSFFMGVVGYVSVFVAQYTGAKNKKGVGISLWQGIYFALIGGLFMTLLSCASEQIFAFIGHTQAIQTLEITYFRILCIGTVTGLLGTSLSCFFSGRGVTTPVLIIHTLGTVLNIPLDYALINGVWGFPEWGIMGAAVATVSSWILIALLFAFALFTKKNNSEYHVLKAWKFDQEIFINLMKYGIPSGVQFFLEILAFTFFILIVGRLGTEALAISNIVLSLNALAYMPMFGFSMGLSTLVGQAIGKKRPDMAVKFTKATTHIVAVYLICLTILFVFFPEPLISLFLPDTLQPEESGSLLMSGVILLRFVTLYLFFDSLAIIYTGTLKGAGDTKFIMTAFGTTAAFILFIPVFFGVMLFDMGLYYSWSCLTFYIFILYCIVFIRYRRGKWKDMQVI